MLPSGRMNWGTLPIGCLFLHGVLTLMYSCVAPVSAMPYCSGLVGGLPLHVVLVLLKFAKFSKLNSLLVTFKSIVSDPNRKRPCVKPNVMPPILVVTMSYALWRGLLLLNYVPEWPPTPWPQQ